MTSPVFADRWRTPVAVLAALAALVCGPQLVSCSSTTGRATLLLSYAQGVLVAPEGELTLDAVVRGRSALGEPVEERASLSARDGGELSFALDNGAGYTLEVSVSHPTAGIVYVGEAAIFDIAPGVERSIPVVLVDPEGWACADASDCVAVCGDGLLRGVEVCDDGNDVGGDGCGATCQHETGTICHPDDGCFTIEEVTIPAVSMRVGCTAGEDPLCTVTDRALVDVPSFAIDASEITLGQWRACTAAGTCRALGATEDCPQPDDDDDEAARCMTFDDAVDYCAWAGKRLCSGAEWEIAARGSDRGPGLFATAPPTCEAVVAAQQTCPQWDGPQVGGLADVTDEGVADLYGNVSEWVGDCYDAFLVGSPADGSARTSCPSDAVLRTLRGASYLTSHEFLLGFQVWDRLAWPAPNRVGFIGARCCRDLE